MARFRCFIQHDSMECGIASLAMVCNHHGLHCSIEKLAEMCPPTREGVSLKGLNDTAHSLGLETICVKTPMESLEEGPLPAILYWEQKHFVVLHKIKNGKIFYIADPAKGNYKRSISEMDKYWANFTSVNRGLKKGIVMFLKPGKTFNEVRMQYNQQNTNSYKAIGFILTYIKPYRKHLLHIIIGLIVSCLLQLILPFMTQSIVDIGIRHKDISIIWLILLGELMIICGRTATDFIRRWLLLHISMRVNLSLVRDFFIKLLKLPMSFFDNKLIGDLLQRVEDHNRVQTFLTNQMLNFAFSSLSFIIFGIVLLIYNQIIFYIFLTGSIIYAAWLALFLRKRKVLDYELFGKRSVTNNKTYQFITSMQEIKLQGCEERRCWEWEDVQVELFKIQLKVLKLQQTQEAGSIFINELKNIIITVLAATAVISGEMTLGAMLAVQYIIGQLNVPVDVLMSFIYTLQDVKISLERISEIHKRQNEDMRAMDAHGLKSGKSIEITNLCFKYDPHALKNTLENISFQIPEGKITAIVGASGSGKTTIIKLLLGYYQFSSGIISISNRNINDYNLKWWRSRCGVVMQDGVIFSDTIARNIAVDGEIDFVRIEKAAKLAKIHDYVMGLPLKYETVIGIEGIGLSRGQKQRILIARAVYKNPDFLFLDEATNALDAENERTIVENLNDYFKGKTVVIVAHRLSTVKNADNIIVMDNGKIIETGTHHSLIREKGTYFNLVKNQLELGD
ncbi:MAG: peptidase domain-containing ABC transporter [Muribaculaceae bacterium]|nr:peptidase domain-containing ABC transporter [Muribaculaceae bacterium]